MNTWTMTDINKATTGITMHHIESTMTYIVMKYIGAGYVFDTKESRVMYSDKDGFVKLYNPNAEENRKHIMIYITTEEKDWKNMDIDVVWVNLVVEESDKPYGTYKANVNKIEMRYYSLNFDRWYFDREDKTLLYTMDYDIAITSSNKRKNRRRNKIYEIGASKLNHFDANKIIQIVNKTNGYKSCRKSQIKSVNLHRNMDGRVSCYTIYIEGKKYPVTKYTCR